jgi:hypothetical protein
LLSCGLVHHFFQNQNRHAHPNLIAKTAIMALPFSISGFHPESGKENDGAEKSTPNIKRTGVPDRVGEHSIDRSIYPCFPPLPAKLSLARTVHNSCNTHGIDSGDIFCRSSPIGVELSFSFQRLGRP